MKSDPNTSQEYFPIHASQEAKHEQVKDHKSQIENQQPKEHKSPEIIKIQKKELKVCLPKVSSKKDDVPKKEKIKTNKKKYSEQENLLWISDVFNKAQVAYGKHNIFSVRILKRFPDASVLMRYLEPFMRVILSQEKSNAKIKRCIKFLVKIATCSTNGKQFSQKFVGMILRYCLKIWNAKSINTRREICQLIGILLHELDHDHKIDDEVWLMLRDGLLLRLTDKIPIIRKSAVIAVSRLQALFFFWGKHISRL